MTKNEIISEIANQQLVEKIVYKYANSSDIVDRDSLADLINDIYLIILDKDEILIQGLYERDELGFYILRIVRNQLFSTHSPYYRDYIVPNLKKSELTDIYEEGLQP